MIFEEPHEYNIAAVGSLREELAQRPGLFQLILSRILYNGSHCGALIPATELSQLVPEVEALAEIHWRCESLEKKQKPPQISQKYPIINLQDSRNSLCHHLANRALANFHLRKISLRDPDFVCKRHLAQTLLDARPMKASAGAGVKSIQLVNRPRLLCQYRFDII
jgi:hypothetical protein